jgi:hypothetical protein
MRREPEYRTSHRMTSEDHVLACVTLREASWSRLRLLVGHVSVQASEEYVGCKQRLKKAVNDQIGIEPAPPVE